MIKETRAKHRNQNLKQKLNSSYHITLKQTVLVFVQFSYSIRLFKAPTYNWVSELLLMPCNILIQFLNNAYATVHKLTVTHTCYSSTCTCNSAVVAHNLLNSEGKPCSKDWICILLNTFHQEVSVTLCCSPGIWAEVMWGKRCGW